MNEEVPSPQRCQSDTDAKNIFISECSALLVSSELNFSTSTAATSSNFARHVLSVLFAGMPPPEPMLIEALTNDIPYGFFSRVPTVYTTALNPTYPGLIFDYNKKNCPSRPMSSTNCWGLDCLTSPVRKKLPYRPSISSLPGQPMATPADCFTRGEHRWSMVQLTAQTSSRSSQPETSNVGSTEESMSVESKMEAVEVTEEEAGIDPVSEPSLSTPSLQTFDSVSGELQIARLKKDVQRLNTAIRNIESRKSELSDWLLEQMLVSQVGANNGESETGKLPEGEARRIYRKRNAKLKQRLAELDVRLSNTILAISRLEDQQKSENDVRFNTSTSSHPPKSSERTSVGGNTGISGAVATRNTSTPMEERQSMTVHSHRQQEKEEDVSPSLKPIFTSSVDRETDLDARPLPFSSLTPMKSYPAPLFHPPSLVSQSAITTATLTGLAQSCPPATVSGAFDSLSPAHLCPDGSVNSPQQPPTSSTATNYYQPLSSKKSHISARRALKHGFGLLSKSIGRRSGVYNLLSSPHPTHALKKCVSAEERLHTTTTLAALNDASTLNKAPFAISDRPTSWNAGASGIAKRKNSGRRNGVSTTDHSMQMESTAESTKKSLTGSVSFLPSSYHHYHNNYLRHHQVHAGGSETTSGAGSDRSVALISSSSPPPQRRKSSTRRTTAPSTTSTMAYSNFIDVIDTLFGDNAVNCTGMPRSSLCNPLVTSSDGASMYSEGGCTAAAMTNGLPAVEAGTTSGGSVANPPFCPSSSPPPALNVAMAIMMLHSRIRAHLETHVEAQQMFTSEIREELASLRMDLTETRNIANSITVEVEALRRDMQTKEEVQKQKLLDAVARLEQLDASTEKLRQNVQQDLITIRNEQKHAIEPINYQLTTETRDLRDMFITLSNKVVLLEKCERLSNLDRDQPRLLRAIANTLTNLVVSLVAFVTTLIQMLIRFLNAGATVTNNRVSAIVLNVCLLVFLLVAFWAESLVKWWCRAVQLG